MGPISKPAKVKNTTNTKPISKKVKPVKKLTVYEQFIEDLKQYTGPQKSPQKFVDVSNFNMKQKRVYELVESKVYENPGRPSPALRLVVQGTAGTGKSAIINAVRALLQRNGIRHLVASFTGNSAYLVAGSTLHRSFRLPLFYHGCSPEITPMSDAAKYLEGIEYFLFDEHSLIGLHLFGYLSEKLNSVHQVQSHFGNKNVILFGDFSQIRPVGDKALFTKNEEGTLDGLELKGHLAYQAFDKAIVLDQIMRQSGPEQQDFREMLSRIRRGQLTPFDEMNLSKRYIRNLSPEELAEFTKPEVTFLFAEKQSVLKYNKYRLELLPTEKHEIWPIDPKTAPPDSAPALTLCVGAKVYLTVNISVAAGLYNGSMGFVTEIGPARKDGNGPECIFVNFKDYTGPRFGIRINDIPIVRHKGPATSIVSQRSWTTEQFPLELAASITCHKSQGQEFERVVIGTPDGPGQRSMFYNLAPSLFFVALSRVKSLDRIVFTRPFDRNVVAKKYPGRHLREWLEEEERLIQIQVKLLNFVENKNKSLPD